MWDVELCYMEIKITFFFSSENDGCGKMWHPRYELKAAKW